MEPSRSTSGTCLKMASRQTEGNLDKQGAMMGRADSANEHFHNQSQCFLHQYDGVMDPILGVKVNAQHSLGEIIADNSGLKHAYRTFEKQLKLEQSHNFCPSSALSPFLAQFTPNQLFFISYSQRNSATMHHLALSQVHPQDHIRVNISLSNSVPFAEAFNCSLGSAMNPKHKCSIW